MTKFIAVTAAALLLASFGAQAATTVSGSAGSAKSGVVVASDSNKCIYNPRNCKP